MDDELFRRDAECVNETNLDNVPPYRQARWVCKSPAPPWQQGQRCHVADVPEAVVS